MPWVWMLWYTDLYRHQYTSWGCPPRLVTEIEALSTHARGFAVSAAC
jgi:hypothetical protein